MPLSPLKDVSPGMIFNDRANVPIEDLQDIQELGKRDSYTKDVGMLQTSRQVSANNVNPLLTVSGSMYGVIADSMHDSPLSCERIDNTSISVKAGSAIDGRGRIITLASDYTLAVVADRYVCLKFVPVDSNPIQHPVTGAAQNHRRDGSTDGATILYVSVTHPKDDATEDRRDDVVLDYVQDIGGGTIAPLRHYVVVVGGSDATMLEKFHESRMVRSSKHIFKDTYGNLGGDNMQPSVAPGANLDRFLACKGSYPRSTTNPFGVGAADAGFTPISDLPYSEDIEAVTVQGAIEELNTKTTRRNPNILLNPTGALGLKFWYGGWDGLSAAFWSYVEGSYGEGYYFARVTSAPVSDEVEISEWMKAYEGTGYNISALLFNGGMTSGQFKLVLRFYDASYVATGSDTELIAVNGDGWRYHSKKVTAPAGARYMRVAKVIIAGSVTTNSAVRMISLQASNAHTDGKSMYVDDAASAALRRHLELATLDHPDSSVTEGKVGALAISEPKIKRTVYDAATPPAIVTEGNKRTNEWLPIMLNDGSVARMDTNTPLSSFPVGKSWTMLTPDYPTGGASLTQAASFGLPLNYGVIETFRHENYVGVDTATGSHQIFIPWISDPVAVAIPQKIRYWKNDNSGWGEWGTIGSGGGGYVLVAAANTPTLIKNSAHFICDGVDDQVQIQAAFAVSSSVMLAPGDYYLTDSIVLPASGKPTLAGAGSATILHPSVGWPAVEKALISNSGVLTPYACVRDLHLEGDALYAYTVGVALYGSYTRVLNVTVNNMGVRGIYLSGGCQHSLLRGCVVTGCGWGGGSNLCGVYLLGFSGVMEGNYVYNNSDHGCIAQGCNDDLTICGNIFNGNGRAGLDVVYSYESLISNNNCQNNQYDGILIFGCIRVSISGNTVVSNNASGSTGDGIHVTDGSDYCFLSGNRVYKGLYTNKQRYGIRIDSANCNYNLISNNDCCNGGVTAGISNAGTNTSFGCGNRNNDGTYSTTPN